MLEEVANGFTALGAARFAQGPHGMALGFQSACELFDVGGFAAALGAFEGNETAGHIRNVSGVAR